MFKNYFNELLLLLFFGQDCDLFTSCKLIIVINNDYSDNLKLGEIVLYKIYILSID